MRISDWSSDVCSSDLFLTRNRVFIAVRVDFHDRVADRAAGALHRDRILDIALVADVGVEAVVFGAGDDHMLEVRAAAEDFHAVVRAVRSEEHTSELQSLMRISYAVFCLKKKKIA